MTTSEYQAFDVSTSSGKARTSASKTRCRQCGQLITWAEQRTQFGRLLRRGWTAGQAKAVLPRCQKCLTWLLRELAASEGRERLERSTADPTSD